jgi:molecular chaperone DnaJ
MGFSTLKYDKSQDLYACLGIKDPAKCEQAEIKKAFYKLAQQCHPDKATGDKEAAAERFKAINNAYEVLSDETQKQVYDSLRQQAMQGEGYSHNKEKT